jgi:flagellar P-ring protein precursor FlgI
VSQPNAFATRGQTAVSISRTSTCSRATPGCSCSPARLNEIVEAVNRVGAAPGGRVAILEALREAGAAHRDLT